MTGVSGKAESGAGSGLVIGDVEMALEEGAGFFGCSLAPNVRDGTFLTPLPPGLGAVALLTPRALGLELGAGLALTICGERAVKKWRKRAKKCGVGLADRWERLRRRRSAAFGVHGHPRGGSVSPVTVHTSPSPSLKFE